jgi:hypothetical protein
MKKLDLSPKNSIGYYWLNKKKSASEGEVKNQLNKRRKILEAAYISNIEYGMLPTKDVLRACHRDDQISFISAYAKRDPSRKFKFESTEYFNKLRFFPDGREKRTLELTNIKLNRFISLYDSMGSGWKKYISKHKTPRNLSGISILYVPEDEIQRISFNTIQYKNIRKDLEPPYKVVDGHHRLACAAVLELEEIPCIVHTLMSRNK